MLVPRLYGLSAPFFHFTCFASSSLLTSFLPSLHRGKEQQAWCGKPTHISGPCYSLADLWSTFYVLSQILFAWSVSGPWPCSWAFWILLQLHLSFCHYCVILRHLQVSLSLSHGGGTGVQNCLHYTHRSRSRKTHSCFPSPYCFQIWRRSNGTGTLAAPVAA